MEETETDKYDGDAVVDRRSTKQKSGSNAPLYETVISTKSKGKKKISRTISGATEPDSTDESKRHSTSEKKDDTQIVPTADQEVPVKPKKKRAPKIDDSIPTDEPVKKKKSKTLKSSPIDDDFQMIDSPTIEVLETYSEPQPKPKKSKKSKKSKASTITKSDSFEELQVTNLDDVSPTNAEYEFDINANDDVPDASFETLSMSGNESSEYQKAIIDSYNNLASNVSFGEFVGDDQWCIINLPKSARTKSKPSVIKKTFPGEPQLSKTPAPKGNLLKRFGTGVNTLMRDKKNMIFGKADTHKLVRQKEEPDDVDTDNLHRYAQRLREVEDKDREVNPEFLVIRDGKTLYGVDESDGDGQVKLAKRKPIYDRAADQKLNEQLGKKNFLARLKLPFFRNRNKNGKNSKSANTSPVFGIRRKPRRKSLDNNSPTTASGYLRES